MTLFYKITSPANKLKFPSGIDKSAKSLIRHLLERDVSKRYGCWETGIEEIKNHRFFKSVDWETIKERNYKYAPFVP